MSLPDGAESQSGHAGHARPGLRHRGGGTRPSPSTGVHRNPCTGLITASSTRRPGWPVRAWSWQQPFVWFFSPSHRPRWRIKPSGHKSREGSLGFSWKRDHQRFQHSWRNSRHSPCHRRSARFPFWRRRQLIPIDQARRDPDSAKLKRDPTRSGPSAPKRIRRPLAQPRRRMSRIPAAARPPTRWERSHGRPPPHIPFRTANPRNHVRSLPPHPQDHRTTTRTDTVSPFSDIHKIA